MQMQPYQQYQQQPYDSYQYQEPEKKCHFIFSCWTWAIIIGIVVVLIIVMYMVLSRLKETYDKVTCNESGSSPAITKKLGFFRWFNPLYAMQTGFNLTVGSITGWRPCIF